MLPVNYKDSEMYYIDSEKMLKFCIENLSKRVSLYHRSLPYNYTVQVFKDENRKSV